MHNSITIGSYRINVYTQICVVNLNYTNKIIFLKYYFNFSLMIGQKGVVDYSNKLIINKIIDIFNTKY